MRIKFVTKANLKTLIPLITPQRFIDQRGYFAETYNRQKYLKIGFDTEFVQDNHSFSYQAGTIRGLHFQAPPLDQEKLVRCGRGSLLDVAVDIRIGSPTFGQWVGYELSADNGHQVFIPKGFAHGFLTLEPESEIIYKCSNYYAPNYEGSLRWNDPEIDIKWPLKGNPILSDKDALAPLLKDFESPFIFGKNS